MRFEVFDCFWSGYVSWWDPFWGPFSFCIAIHANWFLNGFLFTFYYYIKAFHIVYGVYDIRTTRTTNVQHCHKRNTKIIEWHVKSIRLHCKKLVAHKVAITFSIPWCERHGWNRNCNTFNWSQVVFFKFLPDRYGTALPPLIHTFMDKLKNARYSNSKPMTKSIKHFCES